MMYTERPIKKNIYFISRHSGKHMHGTICIHNNIRSAGFSSLHYIT